MPDTALQQIFSLIPTTFSRYCRFALSVLLDVLKVLPGSRIKWWAHDELEEDNNLVLARHPLLSDAIGSINGVNFLTMSADNPDLENATYNSWLHGHYTSCILAFSPHGTYVVMTISFGRSVDIYSQE